MPNNRPEPEPQPQSPAMNIGLVDLDTSHPEAWLPIERELGAQVAGVWDGGSVHPAGYAQQFAQKHGIGRVFESVEQMAEVVDGAIIHSCDWDTHVAKARPFVERGKWVLVDKPLAGNLGDLRQMQRWAAGGARIFGGSSLRFCHELAQWQALPAGERGTVHTALCGCAVDVFNYGIHAYSLLSAAMGAGAVRVRHLGAGVQERIEVQWADGRTGWLVIGEQSGGWMPFYATLVTNRGATFLQPDTKLLYREFLTAVLPWLSGKAEQPPCAFDVLVEPELIALAALQSRNSGGAWVALDAISETTRYDGASFAEGYRRQRYP